MRYALVGYGRMGRAIEEAADRRGHERAAIVDPTARGRSAARTIDGVSWRGIDVAFEFTGPSAAKENVCRLLSRGVGVVCGSTGWDAADPAVRRAARAGKAGAIIAPNFSVGMNFFYELVAAAARLYPATGFDPWIAEWHHRGKLDAPSGTARRLAGLVGAVPGNPRVDALAVRVGHEPGRHVVGFDGEHDAVTLEHAARGRAGFAHGAVLAAEWLRRRRGLHGFDEVLEDLVRGARRRGGRR